MADEAEPTNRDLMKAIERVEGKTDEVHLVVFGKRGHESEAKSHHVRIQAIEDRASTRNQILGVLLAVALGAAGAGGAALMSGQGCAPAAHAKGAP